MMVTQFPPPVHGVSYLSHELLLYWKKLSNFNINIIQLNYSKSINELEKFSIKKILHVFFCLMRIVKYLIFSRKSIIYYTMATYGFALYRDLLFLFLFKLKNKKLVIHLHGIGFDRYRSNLILKIILNFTFRGASIIQHFPKHLENIQWFAPKNLEVDFVPNGISNDYTSRPIEKNNEKKQESSPIKILFFSNMLRTKGPDIALRALALLKEQYNNFICFFCGAPTKEFNEEIFYQMADKLEISKNVRFIGPLYGVDKEKMYTSCDIFIFPSWLESFGNVILEAMKYEIPIVASSTGGISEIIEHEVNGLLFKPKNEEELCKNILKLIVDKNLRMKLAFQAKQDFLNKYTIEKFTKNMSKIVLGTDTIM